MKKLMKKIKSNKLIPKLFAVLTICMVLLSSLSVSAFAADDEVSAANDEAESITDVWTDVMNWITSSLSSAQGVFVSESVDLSPLTLVLSTTNLALKEYSLTGLDFVPTEGQTVTLYLESPLGFGYLDFVMESYEGIFSSRVDLDDFSVWLVYTNSSWGFMYNGPGDPITSGDAIVYYPTFNPSGLTFLGTLAVIGLAIAIAFLIISVISRFLRLRG